MFNLLRLTYVGVHCYDKSKSTIFHYNQKQEFYDIEINQMVWQIFFGNSKLDTYDNLKKLPSDLFLPNALKQTQSKLTIPDNTWPSSTFT